MTAGRFAAWSKGEGSPHVLITAGVHGDEFTPIAAARELIHKLESVEILGRVTIVPIVNEPAFRLGRRVAEDGLDLARTCPGRADGTVTEAIAHELSALIRTADYYIDLHSGGVRLNILPLVGYMIHPDPEVLNAQREMARAFGLPLVWGTDPKLEGRSLSIARDAGIPAIYAEFGGGVCPGPVATGAYVHGCLRILHLRGFVSDSPRSGWPALVVEDDRPNAGYLQIQHPSPRSGYFEPVIQLGQRVERGDVLGRVSDALGLEGDLLVANVSGIVIVVHRFSCVSVGDGLAVILETGESIPFSR